MTQGLRYRATSQVAGYTNVSHVTVVRLEEDVMIELASETGAIPFRALLYLRDEDGGTEVAYTVRFEFNSFIMRAARPVIETMGQAKLKRDLTALHDFIVKHHQTPPAKTSNRNN